MFLVWASLHKHTHIQKTRERQKKVCERVRNRVWPTTENMHTRIYASHLHAYTDLHTINKDKQPEEQQCRQPKKDTRESRTSKKKTTTNDNDDEPKCTQKYLIPEKNRAKEREKKRVTKTKFMDCLHSISLIFETGLCLNLGNHFFFYKTPNLTIGYTKWHTVKREQFFGIFLTMVQFVKSGLELRLTSVDLSLCPSNVIKLQLVVNAAIDDWFMAINMRLNGVKQQKHTEKESNNIHVMPTIQPGTNPMRRHNKIIYWNRMIYEWTNLNFLHVS